MLDQVYVDKYISARNRDKNDTILGIAKDTGRTVKSIMAELFRREILKDNCICRGNFHGENWYITKAWN